ncbi:MAG: DUF1566 domain-containing protein [Desulfobacterales bacterium]|nr:DUF1566 domain-containing protein [Desulfobacterales bacterium]
MRKIALGLLFWVLLPVCIAGAALVDNSDGTITDTQTGLMWQKATAPVTYTWQQALAYAEGLTLSGHSDWRLPNRNELQTLVDYPRTNPAIDPLLAPYTVSSDYWSSTTNANNANYAWLVLFSSGSISYVYKYGIKSNRYYVRAVRAGQSGLLGDSVILSGKVIARDIQGSILGPLDGVTVGTGSGESFTTESTGSFSLNGLAAGNIVLTATKEGYYPATAQVTVSAGDNSQKTVYMTAQPVESGSKPNTVGFDSPQGLHFVSGMPGTLGLEATVAWNGSPGAVRFSVDGVFNDAVTQDVGGGLARATISIPIPTTLTSTTEVMISVTNGDGQTSISATGVFFYPFLEILNQISDILPSWDLAGKTYLSDTEISASIWSLEDPSGVFRSEAILDYRQTLALDAVSGSLVMGLAGFVEGSTTLEYADVENLSGARGDVTGTMTYFLRGTAAPKVQGNVEISGTLKSGFGAPAVYALKLFPPAVPVVDTLLKVPVVKDIIKALRLRLFLIGELGLNGTWAENQNCWLGTETIGGSFTLGAEIQALTDKWGAELGVYAGGTGTPDLGLCPQFSFDGVTIRGYMGVFANAYVYNFSQEFGYELTFGAVDSVQVTSQSLRLVPLSEPTAGWQPVGQSLLIWGEPNRLPLTSSIMSMSVQTLEQTLPESEVKLLENVFGLAGPSLASDSDQTIILFAMYDADKPWHAATDIAQVVLPNEGSVSISRITNDLAAEFTSQLGKTDANTLLGVWSRVTGDISQTESPEQVSAHLEIVASNYDRSSQTWGSVIPLTQNTVTDRDPLPVHFGNVQGVVWVQNQGESTGGEPLTGYRLMYSAWTGSAWTAPAALWADQKSLLDVSFVADGNGQGHVVFSVDEDNDADTQSDREIYHVQTLAGAWQPAARITTNAIEDAIPVLIAPEGTPLCVWRQGEDIVYATVGDWTPKTVYARYTAANAAPSLAGVTLPGGAAITYTVQGAQGMDIFAAFYDALLDQWSLPRQLTHDEHAESALTLDFDGTDLVVAYLKTITERSDKDVEIDGQTYHVENVPTPGRTDLYVLKYRLGYDLAVSAAAVSFEPQNPVPGTDATITAVVENKGDLPVDAIITRFYLGDPNSGGTLIGEATATEPLIPGDTRFVQVNWSVPQEPATHVITVVVDPALAIDDRDRNNNTAQVAACKPDIAIDQAISNPMGPSTRLIIFRVANHGTVPATDIPVTVTRDGTPDQVLHQATIDSLPVDATFDMAFELETSGETTENGYLILNAMANAEKAIDETTYTNNARPLQVLGAVPEKPGNPSIASGAADVSLLPTLDWDNVAAATSYDLYLWKASEARPDTPTVSGLTSSQYTLTQPLAASTEYRWLVVAVNDAGSTESDEWSFTSKSIIAGDVNDDGLVNLTDAVLSLKVLAGVAPEQTVYDAADVDGDSAIGLAEVVYALQWAAGFR